MRHSDFIMGKGIVKHDVKRYFQACLILVNKSCIMNTFMASNKNNDEKQPMRVLKEIPESR